MSVPCVFVGGSQRAGTSMLQLLLCAAENSSPMLREASYLRFLVEAYYKAKTDFDFDTESYFDSVKDLRLFHGEIVETFLSRTLERVPGAQRLILKEPHLTHYFPQLAELLPNARLVLIVRDPRDVIASMIEVGRKLEDEGKEHMFQQRNMAELSNHYRMFYAPALSETSQSFRRRLFPVRYEDIVTRNPETLSALSKFLGFSIPNDDTEIEQISVPKNDYGRYSAWQSSRLGKALDSSSIGSHRSVLKADEITEIEEYNEDILSAFHYR